MEFDDIRRDFEGLKAIADSVPEEKRPLCYDTLLRFWLQIRATDLRSTPIPELYSALMAHHLHQDNLMWGRVQVLALVQAGAFGAAYTLRRLEWAPYVLWGFALALTLLLAALAWKDSRDRIVNQPLMDELVKQLVPKDIKRVPPDHAAKNRGRFISLTSSDRIPMLGSGMRTLKFGLVAFLVFDVCMLVAYNVWGDVIRDP